MLNEIDKIVKDHLYYKQCLNILKFKNYIKHSFFYKQLNKKYIPVRIERKTFHYFNLQMLSNNEKELIQKFKNIYILFQVSIGRISLSQNISNYIWRNLFTLHVDSSLKFIKFSRPPLFFPFHRVTVGKCQNIMN